MKEYLWQFAAVAAILAYLCGIIALVQKVLITPIQVDPANPHYSIAWILGSLLYVCLGVTSLAYTVTKQ